VPDKGIAKTFKGARWALLKNLGDLTKTQAQTLREMKRTGGVLWRAYQLKEALRTVFAGDLDPDTVGNLLDRWCARAQRSRTPEFVKAARTIRKHRDGIDAATSRGMSNGRHEGLNNKIRLLFNRAYRFHSAQAALALVMLSCGPVNLEPRPDCPGGRRRRAVLRFHQRFPRHRQCHGDLDRDGCAAVKVAMRRARRQARTDT
jgi:transposase